MLALENFHYQISGASDGAPWIIFLHGLLGSSRNWLKITPAFEVNFKVLVFDQRGHGKSFKPSTGYAPEDFAGDLKFLMDELGIERSFLVGHSMGGRNALCFAANFPERVSKLVIEDIGPVGAPSLGFDLVKKLRAVPVPFSDKKLAKEYLEKNFSDPKLAMFLYTSIGLDGDGRAVWSFNLDTIVEIIEKGRGQPRWKDIEALKGSTLLIRGEKSEELPRSEFDEVLNRNKNIKGVEIAGAGHWVHFEKPAEFISEVKKFIQFSDR